MMLPSNRLVSATVACFGLAMPMLLLLNPSAETSKAELPNRQVKTMEGKSVSLYGPKLTVLVLTGATCPVAKRYGPTLGKIEAQYKPKGVRFVYVNPTDVETAQEISRMRQANGLKGDYVRDNDRAIVRSLGAKTTTETYLIASDGTILYRGAIDDQYGISATRPSPTKNYLKDAISATLAGKPVKVKKTEAPGCFLDTSANSQDLAVTYASRVKNIIDKNCVECHQPGGVGPFRLDSYASVKSRSAMIRYVVSDKRMPPWFAAEQHPSPWENDRSLSPEDRESLIKWIDAKMPEGPKSSVPKSQPRSVSWSIGQPDATYAIPKPISIPASGVMGYQNVTVPLSFEEERWVSAIEVLPGARQVVHHILVFVEPKTSGLGRTTDLEGINGFFGIYVPGNSALVYPEGSAKRIPADSQLRFQIHYTPNGIATTDRSQIGLKFADAPPKREIKTAGIANLVLNIPPNTKNHPVTAEIKVPTEARVLSFLPHMHVRGQAAKYELIRQSGDAKTILDVPRYDFNWQLNYRLKEPLAVQPGDKLRFTALYNNSTDNPANPDPKIMVRWGEQTSDEMHLGYIEYFLEDPASDEALMPDFARLIARANPIERVFERLDRNRDGFVTEAEASSLWQRIKNLDQNADGKITLEEAKRGN